MSNTVRVASIGDTVVMPVGTQTWSYPFFYSKGINLLGSGGYDTNATKTVLLENVTNSTSTDNSQALILLLTAAGQNYKLSNFQIQRGARAAFLLGGAIQFYGNSTNVWIDQVEIGPINNRGVQVCDAVTGLCSRSHFPYWKNGQPFLIRQYNLFRTSGYGDGSWENSVDLNGGNNWWIVEDCLFDPDSSAAPGSGGSAYVGAIDGWAGCRIMFRFNTLYGKQTHISIHGTESSKRERGGRVLLAYNNLFVTTNAFDTCIDLRSGTGLIYSNRFQGTWNSAVKGNAYRSFFPFSPWGAVDGTSRFDHPDLTDGAGTPGGAGDGVFEAGTITSGGTSFAVDTSKAWTTNQWSGYLFREVDSFVATGGGVRSVTVAGANWGINQWIGREIRNNVNGDKSRVASNTTNTLSLNTEFYPMNMSGGGSFTLSRSCEILSNTTNRVTMYGQGGFTGGADYFYSASQSYEMRKSDYSLDQTGRGLCDVIVGGGTPNNQDLHQALKPVYEWNDVVDVNIHSVFSPASSVVKSGRDFFINTPAPGYSGFTHPHPWVSSANGKSAPTISSIPPQTITKNTSTGPLSFTIADADTPVNNLVVTGSSSDTNLVPIANISITGTNGNDMVTVTPATGQSGVATITLHVTDTDGLSASTAFVLTVNDSPNTPPTISDITDKTTPANHSIGPIAFTIGDAETSVTNLTLTGTSSNQALVPASHITFGGSGANRTVTIDPVAGLDGSVIITVIVTDGASATTSDSFVLTVTSNSSTTSRFFNPVRNLRRL